MSAAPHPRDISAAGRLRVRLNGAVQGVGMRPFVHHLARDCDLAGYVANGADGVTIEVEGDRLGEFLDRLRREAPPLARIDSLTTEAIAATGSPGFAIAESRAGRTATRIPADAATCPDCLRELFDPSSRFFAYPFVNCTHCGPRYTITRRLPYDRRQTSMADFPMCEACAADYADIDNRRYHAEPTACPACGPRLSHPVADIAAAIRAGLIVALKGIGGFHLVCDAANAGAVARLRARKAREFKPFALMVENRASLAAVALPTEAEADLAASPARPVVLMQARDGAVAPAVSPGLARVGVMLAYAPLHHLLFAALAGPSLSDHDPFAPNPVALVATSANPGGEPLVVDDADAARRLGGIADLVVTHDRAIVLRADDSVAQVIAGRPSLIRRARGFVPEPVELPADMPPTLAVGAHLKNTVTLTRGREAFVSQHIGDLDTAETLRFWRECVDHLVALVGVRPDRIACDLHPDYRSSRMAECFGRPVIRLQHHLAHVAAVAAECGLTGPVLGLALDGHGLGTDGTAWGGELIRLDASATGWQRLGHLEPLPLPGGDRAAREPWRMALGALALIGRLDLAAALFPGQALAPALAARLARDPGPATSSLGRLFDAAAALSGLRFRQDYEGQAAMEFEAQVGSPRALPGGWQLDAGMLSVRPLLRHLAEARPAPPEAADLFHGTLVDGLAALVAGAAGAAGDIRDVVLGGGCLMNRTLATGLVAALAARGLRPHLARALPPNDGGLSYGQAVLAGATDFTES